MIENISIINNMKVINKYEVVKNKPNELNYKYSYNLLYIIITKEILWNINNNYNDNKNYSLLKAEEKISNDLLDEYYEENYFKGNLINILRSKKEIYESIFMQLVWITI